MSGTPLFRIWCGIKSRCTNPKIKCYKDYGGRGIGIDERWGEFQNFYDDMASTYQDGLTIEREDNEKGYSRKNCTWATRAKQSRNRRMCIMIDSPWGKMTISEAARLAGLKEMTLYQRIKKNNWPEKDWFIPARKCSRG